MQHLGWYLPLVLAVAAERCAELVVARRNRAWSRRHGGVEYGAGHYPVMVALHTALLVACLVEVWRGQRPFVPVLGVSMLVVLVASQGLRWWCIRTLGHRWNTRIIVVPGLRAISRGPYAVWRHPNYVAVVAEGVALPLVHSAWWTALGFTLANLAVLRVRIRAENAALSRAGAR